jgi:hypothetical protein
MSQLCLKDMLRMICGFAYTWKARMKLRFTAMIKPLGEKLRELILATSRNFAKTSKF